MNTMGKVTSYSSSDNHVEQTEIPKSPHPIDVHVGERIRLRRKLLKMSQSDLAKRVGITFQQVQKYEKGLNRIGAGRLYDIAQILNVEVSFFYHEIPVFDDDNAEKKLDHRMSSHPEEAIFDTAEENPSEPLTSNEVLKLIHYYNRLSTEGKQQILSLCHLISKR